MSSFEICNMEDFVAEVTAQAGSLEEAASTQEIFIQQAEGYLARMRAALCADILALELQISSSGGGGEVWAISEYREEDTVALPSTFPLVPFVFSDPGINDVPLDMDWDSINGAWENISGVTLYCNVMVTISCQDAGSGRPQFNIMQDTGSGFLEVPGSVFWSELGRMSAAKVFRLDMAPGDKVAIGARTIVGATNMINSSSFQILSRKTAT